jgi:membrane-associated HD superfamily phosphohydrolase
VIAGLEKEFTARLEKLQKQTDAAVKAVDDEMQTKLSAAANDDEKAKLNDEYAPKKDQAAKETDKAMQDLSTERTNAIKAAKDKAEAAKVQLEENVKKCKTDRISSDISKETAQCRLKAESVDAFWNKCM